MSRFLPLALVYLLAGIEQASAQVFQVDPRATFLRTDPTDTPQPALQIDLAQLGLRPGDTITLRATGSFEIAPGTPGGSRMVGAFSNFPPFPSQNDPSRIPFALPPLQPPFVSRPALPGQISTDVPNDFLIGQGEITVTIPGQLPAPGQPPVAPPFLLVGADDDLWGDNVDPNNDFVLVIGTPAPIFLGPKPAQE